MTRLTIASFAAIVAATLAVPAAALAQPTAQVKVRYSDLDLNNPENVRALGRRLDSAVDYVCGGQPTSAAEEGANADYRSCRREVMTATLRSVDNPRLTASIEGRRLVEVARH